MDGFTQELHESARPAGARHAVYIAILVAVTLAVGVYLASTMVLIAKDGVVYIEMAKKLEADGIGAVRSTNLSPGYPYLIFLTHTLMGVCGGGELLQGWIVSAQIVSLVSKLIAAVVLYCVGCFFVSRRLSFWGVLILSLLPDSMDFGSDVLTDWPSMMFLATGFLLLLIGSQWNKYWLFGLTGITAGLGYLIRPECGQLVLYGGVWLLFNLIQPQSKIKRTKATVAFILLLAGFAIVAIPYMKSTGYVFPEHRAWKLPTVLSVSDVDVNSVVGSNLYLAGLSVEKLMGNAKLLTNVCETLVYYFVPALAIGGCFYFRRQPRISAQVFFVASFILVNVAITLLQLSYKGYLSRRHTLPLIAFTIFFIPAGLQFIAGWLSRKIPRRESADEQNVHRWFFILMAIGIGICAVKLIRMTPLRGDKQSYRDVAKWLNEHTERNDIIIVPDIRITFYAERKGCLYSDKVIRQAAYLVTIAERKEGDGMKINRKMTEVYSANMNKTKPEVKLAVYRLVN